MKTIVLIHPKIHFEENYPCCWIPFSILSIGSSIPRQKFEVCLFDENCISKAEIFEKLKTKKILLVGLSIMTGGGQIENAIEISKRMRIEHPETKIVFGGPHVNVLPEQTVECDLVDYAISGMGQEVFLKLTECLENGWSVDDIPGLYYMKENKVVQPKVKKAVVNKLVPYDFTLINPEDYIKYDSTISERTLNYIASQGCPYGCRFCYECSYGRKYYRMKSDIVKKDIKMYSEKLHVDGIKFYDADFFVNKQSCDEIISELYLHNMRWAASIHPNDILRNQKGSKNNLLESISRSNCTRLLMGMESGSNRILNEVIKKNVMAEKYIEIAKSIAEYGILGSYTFMVGFPDETEAEREETFELVRKLWELNVPIETKIHIYLPYPGTPLFMRAVELGYKVPNKLEEWSSYNYYKSITPWTDSKLELRLKEFTKMIDKNRRSV